MMEKQKHLSLEGGNIIKRLVQERKSNKAIAEMLGRPESTILRELKRNWANLSWAKVTLERATKEGEEQRAKRRFWGC